MSPTAKAIAYGIVSLAAFALAFWWAYAVLDRAPQGCHAREDAPTVGDAIAEWIRHQYARLRADNLARWWPVRALNGAWLSGDNKLRACVAADAADPEGTAPDPTLGAVPLEVRVTASDGHPAIGFRAGKQPWLTDELPEVLS